MQVSRSDAEVFTKIQNGKKKNKFDFSRLVQSATETDDDDDDDVTSDRKNDKTMATTKDAIVTSHMYMTSLNHRYNFD